MSGPGFKHAHGASAAQFPATLGQTTSAASLSVVIASDYQLPVDVTTAVDDPLWVRLTDGTTAYDAPSADQLPAALGQTTSANSLAVTLASDQSAIPVTQSGNWNIVNISGTVSLPTGAATAANQATGNTSLASIDTKLDSVATAANQTTANASLASIDTALAGTLTVDGSGVTQPVSALALPLPTGASTSANQDTANTYLSNINVDLDNIYGALLDVSTATNQGITNTYLGSIDSTLSNSTLSTSDDTARAKVSVIYNNYATTGVTTSAYTQLVASTSAEINRLYISDTSGSGFYLATGAAASETDVLVVPPGGFDSGYEIQIPASTRLSIKMADSDASTGALYLTALS